MKTYKEIYNAVAGKGHRTKLDIVKAIALQVAINNPGETEDIKIKAYEYLDEMFGIWFDPTVEQDEELHEYIDMNR